MVAEQVRKIPYLLSNTYYINTIYIGEWDWIYKANRKAKIEYYMKYSL